MTNYFIKYISFFLIVIAISCSYGPHSQIFDYEVVSHVDPLVGTSRPGQTIPAVGVPFGMTQWTPQTHTTENHARPPYKRDDRFFCGFRGTHWISGSAMKDYGSFSIIPVVGHIQTRESDFAIPYSEVEESFSPDYYRAQIEREGLVTEATASARCGMLRFKSDKADSLYVLLMPNSDRGDGYVSIDTAKNEVVGYNPVYRSYAGSGKPAGFSGYFVFRFDKLPKVMGTFQGGECYKEDSIRGGTDIGVYLGFKLKAGEELVVRAGTSFTGIPGARKNLDAEIGRLGFDDLRQKATKSWGNALGRIEVSSTDTTLLDVYYTSLYHCMQQPRLFSDVDGLYPKFSRQYETGHVETGDYYDDFSMWDIYRAHLPLFEILDPEITNSWIRSMIIKGQDGGWLPIFPCWNSYTSEMIGDHVSEFIASAYLKGIHDYDIQEAYRLMRQNAFEIPTSRLEYLDGKGRRGLESYLKYGYIPLEDKVDEAPSPHKGEQVSRTLEYAYDDYALAMLARALGKNADYQTLLKRSQNYRNVFDTTVKMVRGRHSNGKWDSPFNGDNMRYGHITEGSPRQYTFYVPQDIHGLANLMGGQDSLESSLDSIFTRNRYWHGNEPGHQIAFMYNYTPSPWKTQKQVRKILLSQYHTGSTGLSGNDDAGQMSAWYVFAATGFYPVSPVSRNYQLCSPLFDKIILHLPRNKQMKIICHKDTPSSKYIRSAQLNGKEYSKNYITYSDLMDGGKLEFFLGETPADWGSSRDDQP